jgi:multiple sugar transport system permease protein
VFLLPGLLVFLVFLALPLALAVFRSLEAGRPGFTEFVGLDNYVAVLANPTFWLAIRNTVVYAVVTVGLGIAISLALAVMIFPYGPRTQAVFKAAFYLPTVISAVVVTMIWAWLYNPPYGILNWFLSLFGAPPVAWLGTSATAMPALMAMSLATTRGVGVILITASMASIPGEIYDAASIDGAGRWTLFRRVTFPLIRPVVLYLLLISTIEASQVFTPMWVLTHGGPQNATTTVAFLIYRTGFLSFDLGTAAAQSMLLLALLLPVSFVYFRVLGRDVEY